jgi:hypothetical protein
MGLYYEVARPGRPPSYTQLESHVVTGRAYSLAVLEIGDRPGWWRVWVDGRPLSPPLHLAASHGRWAPIATVESWNGGDEVCNGYQFRLAAVSTAQRPGGSWRAVRDHFLFTDAGYRVRATSEATFVALRSAASPGVRRLVRVAG